MQRVREGLHIPVPLAQARPGRSRERRLLLRRVRRQIQIARDPKAAFQESEKAQRLFLIQVPVSELRCEVCFSVCAGGTPQRPARSRQAPRLRSVPPEVQ